jgi:prepilin-type N-terminal cleavage/methylation domain-containing protein
MNDDVRWSSKGSLAQRAGFTLIECLVCIGVVAVLLGLTVPLLTSMRRDSLLLSSATSVRTWAKCIAYYNDDNKEYMPRFEYQMEYTTPNNIIVISNFWDIRYAWVALMGPYVSQAEYERLPYSQSSQFTSAYTSFWYSSSLATRPEYWRSSTRSKEALRRGSRLPDVLFPDRKSVLWDADAGYYGSQRRQIGPDLNVRVPIAFLDGSVRLLVPANARPPAPLSGPQIIPSYLTRLDHTEGGASGVDF